MPVKRDMTNFFKQVMEAAPQKRERKDYTIENLFTPTFKDGKTTVVIRFLPPNVNEYKPFVENRVHIQKGFGVDCLEKFGKKCPICEHNHALWKRYPKLNTSKEDAAKRDSLLIVRPNRRYYTNILIVRNDNAPDTEGKVYRFQFGNMILGIINKAMEGHEDSEEGWIEGFNPFLWDEGANFTLEGVINDYGPNWKESKFGKIKPINRYDRKTKTYVPLDTAEQDAIEAQLLTLDEIEKKEAECRTFDEIKDYTEKKFGFKLWSLGTDGKPIQPVDDVAASAPVGDVKESVGSAADDFADDFGRELAKEKSSDTNMDISNDDQSFFDDMENM